LKATISISRDSSDTVRIRLRDSASCIEFADVSASVGAFGLAVTGLSEVEVDLEVRGLQYVGQERTIERRSIECPLNTHDRGALSQWLAENAQEDGWLVSTYLGSQNSISRRDGKTYLNYSVTRYGSKA
jgi:hypothetical protein